MLPLFLEFENEKTLLSCGARVAVVTESEIEIVE